MNETIHQPQLSEDQLKRIAATLGRIREGLASAARTPMPEPAHFFTPRQQDTQ